MRFWKLILAVGIAIAVAGCKEQPAETTMQTVVPTIALTYAPTQVFTPTLAETPIPQSTNNELPNHESTNNQSTAPSPTHSSLPSPTFDPQTWKDLPVIPTLSPRAVEILKAGLGKGNNPHAFSKIGDCESQASWFLENFDLGAQYYSLGKYEAALSPVIAYYSGSYKRVSLAARPGFSAASLMAPIWANKDLCQKGEGPLACEYRMQRPMMAFIMLGSNDASNPKTFEGRMRTVIEYSIGQGVLPVLGTKADNVEKDYSINTTIARLGAEYGLPVWNFWAAVQSLPDHGLQKDGVHLTFGNQRFDDPANMENAWPVRNLNALQILKVVMDQTESLK